MISSDNLALNNFTNDEDFTYSNYRQLLKMAKSGWKILDYRNIDWDEKFIVWRHDVDYSLNCSLKLAKIEQEEGVKSTYFINPHSEFYNIAELSQYRIIKEILSFGHDIGLHFDSAFYEIKSEADLNITLSKESSYIEDLLGVKPTAFSFHNPVSENLECEAYEYGGLTNCYSLRFKEEVGYCSDSNGFWRFDRLHDVLGEAEQKCLQILTHPGWWHEKPMPPRLRIFRSVYGRAAATMRFYDQGLIDYERLNIYGPAEAAQFLRLAKPTAFELYDYLWSSNHFHSLFLELWRLLDNQIHQLCRFFLLTEWNISNDQIEELFARVANKVDGWDKLQALFSNKYFDNLKSYKNDYKHWHNIRFELAYGSASSTSYDLELICVALCQMVKELSNFGIKQNFNYDGLSEIDSNKLTEKQRTISLNGDDSDHLMVKFQQNWYDYKQSLIAIADTN